MEDFTTTKAPETLKQRINFLRESGWSYNQIAKELGCRKSTISYHLNANVKASNKRRMRLDRSKRGARKLNKKLLGNILGSLISYKQRGGS